MNEGTTGLALLTWTDPMRGQVEQVGQWDAKAGCWWLFGTEDVLFEDQADSVRPLAAVVSSSPATPACDRQHLVPVDESQDEWDAPPVPIGDVAGIYDHLAPSPATPERCDVRLGAERCTLDAGHKDWHRIVPSPASPAETREGRREKWRQTLYAFPRPESSAQEAFIDAALALADAERADEEGE